MLGEQSNDTFKIDWPLLLGGRPCKDDTDWKEKQRSAEILRNWKREQEEERR